MYIWFNYIHILYNIIDILPIFIITLNYIIKIYLYLVFVNAIFCIHNNQNIVYITIFCARIYSLKLEKKVAYEKRISCKII